ncbi:MAG: glycosyltransferase [Ilumatobacter sp.]|nr:glycosyltransferase [Ilumatobacter sp.]
MTRLLVITQSFPFGNRIDFLEDEIGALADAFDTITLAPTSPAGECNDLPDNVDVDMTLCPRLTRGRRLRSLLSFPAVRLAAREMRLHARTMARPRQLARALLSVGGAAAVTRWYRETAVGSGRPSVVYSYWLTESVLGIRRADPSVPIVSRVHGGDLFLERHPGNYIPQHESLLRACSAVASVSDRGHSYLVERYPMHRDRLHVRRLGTRPFPASSPSADSTVRVVTCSSLTAVKRPVLAAEAIVRLAEDRNVVWDHFGDGPLRPEVERVVGEAHAGARSPGRGSLRFTLHGAVPNTDVAEHFESHAVDVLLNTSSSEGVAVSMMEALSAGVPVVATAVGGTPEIITDGNGRLVPPDPDAARIAEAIAVVADDPGPAVARIEFWRRHYAASSNYEQFAQWLTTFLSDEAPCPPR